jgi:hypothetical protein
MSMHRPAKKIRYGLGLGAFALVISLGLVAFRAQTLDDETFWGSPTLDTITFVESTPQIGTASDVDSGAAATYPTATSNAMPNGSNTALKIADTAPAASYEIALSLGADPGPSPPSGALHSSSTDPVGVTEPTSLAIEDGGGAGGNSGMGPLAASAGSPSGFGTIGPDLPGGISLGASPISATLPATAAISPAGGNSGTGPQTGGTPPAHSPGGSGPQTGTNPTNPAAPISPSAPTGGPVGSPSLGAPSQPTGGGTPPSIVGASPATTNTPGQTPAHPITPIASTPNGTAILPISGTGCGGANCSTGNAWRFFDPPVAVGYDYQLNPTTTGQSLTFGITGIMATTKVGLGVYDLWLYDTLTGTYVDSRNFSSTGQTITISADPSANPNGAFDVVPFLLGLTPYEDRELGISDPYLGLTQFSIRGIDPKAGLNPEDPNAFITGLLFAGDINGDLLITPLAVDSSTNLPVDPPTITVAIPEPATIALFIAALACLGFLGRQRKSKLPRRCGSR